jgi:hypothetical protein
MAFYGHPTELYAAVLYMIFAVITGVLCLIQLVFLQKLNIWSVYWLPLLSFCMCYENVLLYLGDHISRHSSVAYAGNVFHALQIPIFVIVLYEVSYRLHEARSAQFLYYIRFDLGGSATELTALLSLWIVRTIAAGLFVMTLITDFFILPKNHRSKVTGAGGYYAFSRDDNEHSVSLWLNLIPPIVLTVAGITIGISLYRFVYQHSIAQPIHLVILSIYPHQTLFALHLQYIIAITNRERGVTIYPFHDVTYHHTRTHRIFLLMAPPTNKIFAPFYTFLYL